MSSNYIGIKVTSDSLKPNNKGFYKIKLRIKGNKKKTTDIGVEVKVEHWDESYGHITAKHRANYPNYTKKIDEIYSRIEEVKPQLMSGLIGYSTAFDRLLGRHQISGSILDFVKQYEPDAKTGSSTLRKHYDNIRALQGKLAKEGLKKYTPIEFSHLQDETAIENIATYIIRKGGYKQNYQASLIKSLNWVTVKAKLSRKRPFTELGFLPSEKASDKNKPTNKGILLDGLNNIKTMKQFEAYLFWLYSFCLLGLDGKDIARLNEDHIVNKDYNRGDLTDYLPEADVLDGGKRFFTPYHIHLKRGKSKRGASDSGVDAITQVNLTPTLIVLELLKYAISFNNYSYRGKDLLRLYNFDVDTETGAEKWERIRKIYSSTLSDKVGTTTQQARHTVTKMGSRLGLDDKKIDRYLNHSTSGVIKHYLDKEQVEQDVFQIHIFQEFGLLEIVKITLDLFKKRTVRVNEKDVPFIPFGIVDKKLQGRTVPILHRSTILSRGILTKFSREDEVRYQTLLNDIKEGTRVIENGRIVRKEVAKNKYPKELQKLIEKRKQLYVKPPMFKQELLDKIDISTSAVQDDSPQVAKAKEIIKVRWELRTLTSTFQQSATMVLFVILFKLW